MRDRKKWYRLRKAGVFLLLLTLLCMVPNKIYVNAAEDSGALTVMYEEYRQRFDQIEEVEDIETSGFRVAEAQRFPASLQNLGEVTFIPAMDETHHRLALFFADENDRIVYKTEALQTNSTIRGALQQPNKGISAVSFQDMNEDGKTDIVLITSCENREGNYAGNTFKIGDVLFQNETGFYRDYRISDKINRFGMNKNIEFITAFVRDGYTTEFLYTAATLDGLLDHGFEIITEQCYYRQFEKLGRLQVVPGTYKISDYEVFMIYLVNEQGYIVWSLQPMGDYDNLYALKGIKCMDIDGDGLKDVLVLARYSYEGSLGALIIKSDYSIYYQRTGGFEADTGFKSNYKCNDSDTMEELVSKAREYWGWNTKE